MASISRIICAILFLGPAAQTGAAEPSVETYEITIDLAEPVRVVPKRLVVENGAIVKVRLVNKSPFEVCKAKFTETELPKSSPMPDILSALTGLGSFFSQFKMIYDTVVRKKEATDCDQQDPLIEAIESYNRAKKSLEEIKDKYRNAQLRLDRFLVAEYGGENCSAEIDGNRVEFGKEIDGVLHDIWKAIDATVPNIPDKNALIASEKTALENCVDRALDEIQRRERWRILNAVMTARDELKTAVNTVKTIRTKLRTAWEKVAELRRESGEYCSQTIRFNSRSNMNVKALISCTAILTGEDAKRGSIPVRVTYSELPRLRIAAGFLWSSLQNRSYSVQAAADAISSESAIVQFQRTITEETGRLHIIPFSFFNIRLADARWKQRVVTFNLTPGLGINPNGSSTHFEIAVGGSVGVSDTFIFLGVHFGRPDQLGGGFQPGDIVSATFPETPIVRSWERGFSIGISYSPRFESEP